MSLDHERNEKTGEFSVKATGKDVKELAHIFDDVNGDERDRRLSEAGNGERVLRNQRGGAYIAKEERIDKALSEGQSMDWDDRRPGVVMPARYLGMDRNGLVVWDRQEDDGGEWHPSQTIQGLPGWSRVPDWRRESGVHVEEISVPVEPDAVAVAVPTRKAAVRKIRRHW